VLFADPCDRDPCTRSVVQSFRQWNPPPGSFSGCRRGVRRCPALIGGVGRAVDAAQIQSSDWGNRMDEGEWDKVSQSGSAAGGTTTAGGQGKSPREPWYQRHQHWHNALCVLAAAATGFLGWWIVAEAATPDGTKAWWTALWDWVLIVVAVVAVVAGGLGAWRYRAWKSSSRADEEDASLFWLVVGGILASVVLASAMAYAQAELLTAPSESVTSLEHDELLDIARATTFALGALGAVAVLLVNYRKQRSVEATLAHERVKQRASEISALHERYTKAVEQLAEKDNAAIRLGGVHALAALGDDWAAQGVLTQRQVCVDLLCSYLRSNEPIEDDTDGDCGVIEWVSAPASLREDRDVRKAALEWLSRLASADHRAQVEWARRRSSNQSSKAGKAAGYPEPWAPGVVIDLRGIVLRELDLSYAKLSHLPLPQADFIRANLTHADLTGTNLRDAEIRDATLTQVKATGADLTLARMTEARMRMADLRGADLTRAHLGEARLVGARLGGADLSSANLWHADLAGAKVDGKTCFIGAVLYKTNFDKVALSVISREGVDFSEARNVSFEPPENQGNDSAQPRSGEAPTSADSGDKQSDSKDLPASS